MTFESACEHLGSLYSQINPAIFDSRDGRLWNSGKVGQFILTKLLELSDNPYRIPDRYIE